jgi:hypothetical protein
MSQSAVETETSRPPNRGFRPPPAEYDAAHENLPRGRSMTDYLRACLDLLANDPATAERVLDGHWPEVRRGRPPGSRDARPRALRGGGNWWAVWDQSGDVHGILAGPAGLSPEQAVGVLRVDRGFRVEQCDNARADELSGWHEKSDEQKAALRPDLDSLPAA